MVLFVVISVVRPWSITPLNYGDTRSAFDDDERMAQTILTFKSIKKYAPYADVLLVEAGRPIDKRIFTSMGVNMAYIGGGWIRRATASNSKAFGEASIMLRIMWKLLFSKYDYFYKISGRYELNEHFEISKWDKKHIGGKDIYGDRKEISTRLIGIPKSQLWRFYRAIVQRIWKLPKGGVYEGYILKGIGPKHVSWLDEIGVQGYTGVERKFIKE